MPVERYLTVRQGEKPLGVYALYDSGRNLQYVGYARNMTLAIKVLLAVHLSPPLPQNPSLRVRMLPECRLSACAWVPFGTQRRSACALSASCTASVHLHSCTFRFQHAGTMVRHSDHLPWHSTHGITGVVIGHISRTFQLGCGVWGCRVCGSA